MITFVFVTFFFIALIGVLSATSSLRTPIGNFLVLSFLARLPLHWVSRNVVFFSHGTAKGDWLIYEMLATYIARKWEIQGVHYATDPELGYTTLPSNIFAVLVYLNGGPTPLGCTALVAFCCCVTALNLYFLGIELDVDPKISLRFTVLFFSSPAILYHTSDMFKDGLVLMFVLGAVASGIRLSRRFSILDALLGLLSLWALWYVRYYMVFLSCGPFLIGFIGLRSKGWIQAFLMGIIFLAGIGFLAGSNLTSEVSTMAQKTFALSTDKNVGNDLALGASGVRFEAGPGAYPLKVIYTLFSPFPWAGGSLGFNIGKIDTLFFYYIMYRAYFGVRKLWKEDRVLLGMLASFVVPTTIAYAMTMANVGLILRQRLPVVAVVMLLAMRSWPSPGSERTESERRPSPMRGVVRPVRVAVRRPARTM